MFRLFLGVILNERVSVSVQNMDSLDLHVIKNFWCTLPEDGPQETVETCWSPSVLIKAIDIVI